MRNASLALILGALTLAVTPSYADDWAAVRLRGAVFALSDGQWVQLARGDIISDDRVIKSAPASRVTLARGAETIEIGPASTVQISDRAGFTTIYNHEGTVGVDAEVRNVQHFAVQTQFLAAVVKGTAFTVSTNSDGSTVAVVRGAVSVDDHFHDGAVLVPAGQQVSSSDAPIRANDIVPIAADSPRPPAPAAAELALLPKPPSSNQGTPSGNGNSGNGNSGNGNSGNGNGGNGNSGNGNGGNGNSGNGNSGNGNSGNGNGGNGNGGNGNGGNGNSGNGNSGNGNGGNDDDGNDDDGVSGNGNSGNGNGNSGNGNSGNGNGKGKSGKGKH